MTVLIYILAAVCGYLVAGLNPAIAMSKAIYHKDIRECGSGNPGFTNFKRTFGNKWAWWVLVLDLFKAAVVVWLFAWLLSRQGVDFQLGAAFTGVFCMLGHAFPLQYKFKGGKGVSTGAGVALALAPLPLLCALALWVVLFLLTRYVSVASIAAAVGLPVFAYIFRLVNVGNTAAKSTPVLIFFCAIAAITVYRHRSNIKRLLDGTENRFEKKH